MTINLHLFQEKLRQWALLAVEDDERGVRLSIIPTIMECAQSQSPNLNLSQKGLTSIPACLEELEFLENLNLSQNRITHLPEVSADGFPSLKTINLMQNNGKFNISEDIKKRYRVVTSEEITRARDFSNLGLQRPTKKTTEKKAEFSPQNDLMRAQDFSNLELHRVREETTEKKAEVLPQKQDDIYSASSYEQKLYKWASSSQGIDVIESTNRTELVAEIMECRRNKAETLNLSHRLLTSIPPCLEELEFLKHLDLSNNRIDRLPEASINGFRSLETINLLQNDPDLIIPESIRRLPKLEQIYADKFVSAEVAHFKFHPTQRNEPKLRGREFYEHVTESSTITHYQMMNLLRIAFTSAGMSTEEFEERSRKDIIGVVPIGNRELDHFLRDSILKFMGQNKFQEASFALCYGQIVRGEIVGDSHWTGLHLRVNSRNEIEIIPYFIDSKHGDIPLALQRSMKLIKDRKFSDLSEEVLSSETMIEAQSKISSVKLESPRFRLCTSQEDNITCGYHAAFGLVSLHHTKKLGKEMVCSITGLINYRGSKVGIEDFIANSRRDLQQEFNHTVISNNPRREVMLNQNDTEKMSRLLDGKKYQSRNNPSNNTTPHL